MGPFIKFMNPGCVGPHSNRRLHPDSIPPLPGEPILCKYGYHYCAPEDALDWIAAEAYWVEPLSDETIGRNKRASCHIRMTRIDAWTPAAAAAFARDCVERVERVAAEYAARYAAEAARYATDYTAAAAEHARGAADYTRYASGAAQDAAGAAAAAKYTTQSKRCAAWWPAAKAEKAWQVKRLMQYLKGEVDVPRM